jgi:hypothetical protein
MNTLRLALASVFARRWAYVLALASGLAMLLLLAWNSGGLKYYPRTGWEFYADPLELASIVVLSALFGLLVPMELAAVDRSRAGVGAASGLAGAIAAIAGVSCCAPMLLPALLSFVGFSGTALLVFNASLRRLMGPLELASVILMVASIVIVSHTLTATCKPPGQQVAGASGVRAAVRFARWAWPWIAMLAISVGLTHAATRMAIVGTLAEEAQTFNIGATVSTESGSAAGRTDVSSTWDSKLGPPAWMCCDRPTLPTESTASDRQAIRPG